MRKRCFVLYILMVWVGAGRAQSLSVMGVQSGIWEADTVHVTDNVFVQDSLLVLPGTVVLFDRFFSITVGDGAVFLAQGTVDDSIRFTVADTTGMSLYNSGRGGWNGLGINNAKMVQLDYCVLEYGKAADESDQWGGALNVTHCRNVMLSNCSFRNNFSRERGGAIHAEDSHLVFSDCQFLRNRVYTEDNVFAMYGGAADFQRCDVEMTGMELRGNYGPSCIGGALSFDSCAVFLDRAVFVDNIGLNGGGMYLMRSNHKECRLSNLLFDGNFSGHFGGGMALSDVSPEIYNILVTNNQSEGVSCNGIFFYQECAPKMSNCIIYGNYPANPLMDTTQMWLWTYGDYAPEMRNCLIEGDTAFIRGAQFLKVFEDIIDADPLFVDAENHDFRLSENSPCRDAGWLETPDYITGGLDLEGLSRLANYRIDIGPYEYSPAGFSEQQPQPSFARLIGNPLKPESRLVLELDQAETVAVKVYTLTGRATGTATYRCEAGSNNVRIGSLVEGLAPGVYLIEIIAGERICSLKAVR